MNGSNRVLLALVGGVTIVVTVVVLSVTVFSSHSFSGQGRGEPVPKRPSSGEISRVFPLSGFTGVAASGAWNVTVHHGVQPMVSVTVPADLADRIDVSQEGAILTFALTGGTVDTSGRMRADVTMPDLSEIDLSGATILAFAGFRGDRLLVRCSGAAAARGSESRFGKTTVSASGAADVTLRTSPTREAKVEVSGASRVVLTLEGGPLSGDASGVGQIVYDGTASQVSVHTSGAAQVIHGERSPAARSSSSP